MSDLKLRDMDVLRMLAEAGVCRAKQLHGHVTHKHRCASFTTRAMNLSLTRLEKAGLVYKAREGTGFFRAPKNKGGGIKRGTAVAHRWAVTEDGRLLSGFSPPV